MTSMSSGTCAKRSCSWPKAVSSCGAPRRRSAQTGPSSRSTWARAMSETPAPAATPVPEVESPREVTRRERTSVSLEVDGLRSGYHGVMVLKGLDFTVGDEIFSVLGANGAGKTTLLATLARLIPLMAGTIRFNGEDVSASPPYETAGRGIGYVP